MTLQARAKDVIFARAYLRVRKKVQNHFREKRIYFKRNKHILNKKGKKLTLEEYDRLREILKQFPELQRAYALKEGFFNVFSM